MVLKVNSLNRTGIAINLTNEANILLIIILLPSRLSQFPKGIRDETKEDIRKYHHNAQMKGDFIEENNQKEKIIILKAWNSQ